jgi:hypothetical protein
LFYLTQTETFINKLLHNRKKAILVYCMSPPDTAKKLLLSRFQNLLHAYQAEHKMTAEEVMRLLEEETVPVSIFRNRKLGILE